jgi:hypothetical protein
MKNNFLKYYIAAFYFASTVILFATETPGVDNEDGNMEGAEVAPIDDYVWVLALVGLVTVFMKFRAMHKNKIQG